MENNKASADLEKGLSRETTGRTDSITQVGQSSPKSASWSLRQLISTVSSSSSGAGQTTPQKWLWSRSAKVPSESEFPEEEDEKLDKENIVRRLQDCPKGYPLLAAFLDSDDNFMIYRRFGYLQARLLLEKQEQLRRLEWELEVLDENDKQASSRDLITFADNEDGNVQERQQLMQRIEEKFRDYGTSRRFLFHRNSLTCQSASLLQVAESLVRCNRPSSGEHCSVRNFINYRQPLVPSEQRFINCKEDLITLRPGREHAWLDSSVEKALKWLRCDLIEYIFCSKDSKQKTDGAEVYYTRERIDVLVGTIIILMILVLLVVPVYLLLHLTIGAETTHSNAVCIGILLVSTLLFSACITAFTRARRHEVLGAAAAYCAVMVVFLGSNGHSGLLGPTGLN